MQALVDAMGLTLFAQPRRHDDQGKE